MKTNSTIFVGSLFFSAVSTVVSVVNVKINVDDDDDKVMLRCEHYAKNYEIFLLIDLFESI